MAASFDSVDHDWLLRMHQRLRDQHRWLAAVLRGHYAYFGIPGNSICLGRFRLQVMKAWRRILLRRSQRPKLSWGAVQRDPEGLPDTDRASTRLASPNGLMKLLVRGAGRGKAVRPDL